jgi:hypothetical protein
MKLIGNGQQLLGIDTFNNREKLFASPTIDRISRPKRARERLCDAKQYLVSYWMTVRVIDFLKVMISLSDN